MSKICFAMPDVGDGRGPSRVADEPVPVMGTGTGMWGITDPRPSGLRFTGAELSVRRPANIRGNAGSRRLPGMRPSVVLCRLEADAVVRLVRMNPIVMVAGTAEPAARPAANNRPNPSRHKRLRRAGTTGEK